MSPRLFKVVLFGGCAIVLAVVLLAGLSSPTVREWFWPPLGEWTQQAEIALGVGRLDQAETLVNRVLARDGTYSDALILLGLLERRRAEQARAGNDFSSARQHAWRSAAANDKVDEPGLAGTMADRSGAVLAEYGWFTPAEARYRVALEHDPGDLAAHQGLGHLLRLVGRRDDAQDDMLFVVRAGKGELSESLLHLANPNTFVEIELLLRAIAEANPTDPMPRLGLAAIAVKRGKTAGLEKPLTAIIDDPTANTDTRREATVLLGRTYLLRGEQASVAAWWNQYHDDVKHHPQAWIVLGRWAQTEGRPELAARAYWEAGRLDPTNAIPPLKLAALLGVLRRDADVARRISETAKDLAELEDVTGPLYGRRNQFPLLWRLVNALERLGRPLEAAAWARFVLEIGGRNQNSPEMVTMRDFLIRVEPLAESAAGRQILPGHRWETWIDLADLSLPARPLMSKSRSGPPATSPNLVRAGGGAVSPDDLATKNVQELTPKNGAASNNEAARAGAGLVFTDEAHAVGIDVRFLSGNRKAGEGHFMHSFTGGGVGVLDYDRDGWPDLYVCQAGPDAPTKAPFLETDRLFRNQGDGTFADVTEAAGLREDRYSQGVAIGDINSDGWPDVYVGNAGKNRLYLNQGDGTFLDATDQVGITGDDWTTSVLMADLTGDGRVDLYDANYVAGSEIYTLVCQKNGEPDRGCAPGVFDSAPDRLWQQRADGTFVDVSGDADIRVQGSTASATDVPESPRSSKPRGPSPRQAAEPIAHLGNDRDQGNGLGLVAADFRGVGALDLFVANDQDANFFFQRQPNAQPSPGTNPPRFVNDATLAGLAFDSDGRALACMGVAVGDIDGNGLLDLFVTNFHNEPCSLYRQLAPGIFNDDSRGFGLYEPTFPVLGFGTQCVDVNADGWLDLILVNGHIDDFSYNGTPWKMRPQLFLNQRGERFVELTADALGPFFGEATLGRALARLDWNRDRKDDAAITHLDRPLALLTNRSATDGHAVSFQLVAATGDREAVGTTLTLTVGDRTLTHQLTAGDGYLSSNDRRLVIGLGDATTIDSLEIRWPDGTTSTARAVQADRDWLLVEGEPAPRPLPSRHVATK